STEGSRRPGADGTSQAGRRCCRRRTPATAAAVEGRAAGRTPRAVLQSIPPPEAPAPAPVPPRRRGQVRRRAAVAGTGREGCACGGPYGWRLEAGWTGGPALSPGVLLLPGRNREVKAIVRRRQGAGRER